MSSSEDEIGPAGEGILDAFEFALLDSMTPNLIGIHVTWTESHISGVYFYEGDISEDEEELVSDAEGEVIAHFSVHMIDFVALGNAENIDLDQFKGGVWIYRRSPEGQR
jgi:hypothetical protein